MKKPHVTPFTGAINRTSVVELEHAEFGIKVLRLPDISVSDGKEDAMRSKGAAAITRARASPRSCTCAACAASNNSEHAITA
jgi:hypothetical protein